MARGFPDGVWLVPLGSIQDTLLVPEAVFNALGVEDLSTGFSPSTLTDHVARNASCSCWTTVSISWTAVRCSPACCLRQPGEAAWQVSSRRTSWPIGGVGGPSAMYDESWPRWLY